LVDFDITERMTLERMSRSRAGTGRPSLSFDAPAGQEGNWVLAREAEPYFVMFRIYGPQKAAVDESWMLNDITRAQ
jgi:hypothetical protein